MDKRPLYHGSFNFLKNFGLGHFDIGWLLPYCSVLILCAYLPCTLPTSRVSSRALSGYDHRISGGEVQHAQKACCTLYAFSIVHSNINPIISYIVVLHGAFFHFSPPSSPSPSPSPSPTPTQPTKHAVFITQRQHWNDIHVPFFF